MYHIKNDKRAYTSAKLIGNAVLQLLKEKEFNNISISEIQRVSSVGRSTFYRLFDNVTDVLQYLCDQINDEVLQQYKTLPEKDTQKFFIYFIDRWTKNEALLAAIFNYNHSDILYKSFRNNSSEVVGYVFPALPTDDKKVDYLTSIATTALAGILSAWLNHGKMDDVSEILELVKSSFYYLNQAFNN